MKKGAPVITAEQEAQLWETGYYNGKYFCLRGVCDHELLFNQKIHLLRKLFRIQFCEHGSKYNQNGVQKQSLTVKSVTINAVPGSHHCHVKIFQAYLSHVTPSAVEQN